MDLEEAKRRAQSGELYGVARDVCPVLLDRIAELEAELTKVKGYPRELAERCYRKDLELDELRERRRSRGD